MRRSGVDRRPVQGASAALTRSQVLDMKTPLLDFYGRSRRARANDLSETVKLVILLGQYMQDNYQGRYYAKAQNAYSACRLR
jgi:hypothetical protein